VSLSGLSVRLSGICVAGEADPVPVSLYEDPADPGNSFRQFLGVTGFIGDTPFAAMVANACGHAALKACKFCFLLGDTFNYLNEKLGATRFGGFVQPLPGQPPVQAHKYDETAGTWETVPVCWAGADGAFNQAQLESMRITPELQAMRRRLAEDVRTESDTRFPRPHRPADAVDHNEAQAVWQDGTQRYI